LISAVGDASPTISFGSVGVGVGCDGGGRFAGRGFESDFAFDFILTCVNVGIGGIDRFFGVGCGGAAAGFTGLAFTGGMMRYGLAVWVS
jgi:hypothetical protein